MAATAATPSPTLQKLHQLRRSTTVQKCFSSGAVRHTIEGLLKVKFGTDTRRSRQPSDRRVDNGTAWATTELRQCDRRKGGQQGPVPSTQSNRADGDGSGRRASALRYTNDPPCKDAQVFQRRVCRRGRGDGGDEQLTQLVDERRHGMAEDF
jgi:hypothetical protein